MSKTLLLLALTLLLAGCASLPPGESPLEAAQRRLPAEPPLLIAEGCLYQTNLLYLPHYLREESRKLAADGAQELVVAMKEQGIPIRQQVLPLICASELPPRGEAREGRLSASAKQQDVATLEQFPISISAALDQDSALKAAYGQLFAACDDQRYRRERLWECPLLKPEQAALLKARLKVPYVLLLSIAGERSSAASRTGGALLGFLLGGLAISTDQGYARLRLVSLETGGLVWSSFEPEFNGVSPSGESFGVSNNASLRLTDDWTRRMLKTLFAKQR